MAAIGLLDIPPEVQLQIAGFVETRQTLKALSVTSRSLRSIAQSILFTNLQIDLGKELRCSVDDLLANPQICAAIRFLWLRGRFFSSAPPRNDEEQLSIIQKLLPEMVGLRKVSICFVNLSKTFLDAFLGIATNMPLQIDLGWNIYPYSVFPTPYTTLQISHLCCSVNHPQLEFYRSMFHASATTLTGLNIQDDGDGLMELADINLPFLRDFTLSNTTEDEIAGPSVGAFLTAQMAIRRLVLEGDVGPLPPIPPNALPNLRELKASPKLVNQLVPGRPVETIEVTFPQIECIPQVRDWDWFGEEVGESTARVRRLQVHNNEILNTRMVKRMVTLLPFLEDLWLPVFGGVSWPFRPITSTLVAHFPSGIPRCHRSPHFTQVPQETRLLSALSRRRSMGRPQHQRHRYQTAEGKSILLVSRDLGQ